MKQFIQGVLELVLYILGNYLQVSIKLRMNISLSKAAVSSICLCFSLIQIAELQIILLNQIESNFDFRLIHCSFEEDNKL